MIHSGEIPIDTTVKYAPEQFERRGWAESVLLAVSKAAGKDCGCIPNIAVGFKGGLMTGEVCGAWSSAAMAIGLLNGVYQEDVTHLTAQFMRQFAERNGAVRCIDILGFNVGSINNEFEVGSVKDFFQFLARGGKRSCNKVVRNAVEVLLEELNEWEA